MNTRSEGQTQEVSAAKAGISVRSARSIEQGKRQNPHQQLRHWSTRKDPLASVWGSVLQPMLAAEPKLQAITLLEYLQIQHPDQYPDSLLRTLQRRVKHWRATQGPEKEVMFRQQQIPGRQGLSDFTKLKEVVITISGQEFNHLLYHFRLAFSKWSYIKIVLGGESYTALAEGLQEALHLLGGAPLEHRTDSLSAAYKNLSKEDEVDVTDRYEAFCTHYSMKATRNNRGKGHENGAVESPHGHIKRRIKQALFLRGNSEFESVASYQHFLDDVVRQHNGRHTKELSIERPYLQNLPSNPTADYIQVCATVSSSSTIDVRRVTYTVHSRLIGSVLHIRLYDDRLDGYLGRDKLFTLNRLYPLGKSHRARQIDYKHVTHSLVKKPQAFRHSRIREDLLPTIEYKTIWGHIDTHMPPKTACRLMVGLLHLAATQDCQQKLAQVVLEKIGSGKSILLSSLQCQFSSIPTLHPAVMVEQHVLKNYDQYIPQIGGRNYVG